MAFNAIIDVLRACPTPEELLQKKDSISTTNSAKNNTALNIFYQVLLADLLAQKQEKINTESSTLYQKANDEAVKSDDEALLTWVQTHNGFYYYTYNDYLKALPYFLKSARKLNTFKANLLIDGVEVYKKNAYFFSTIKDFNQSIHFLKKALLVNNNSHKAALLDAIGLNYYEQRKTDSAFYYFQKAQKAALNEKDKVRYAKVLGNKARTHILNKNWDEAERLLLKDIEISEQEDSDRNTMFAQIELGKLYLAKNDFSLAKRTIYKAQKYAAEKPYLKSYKLEIAELLLPVAIAEKNTGEELMLRRTIDSLKTNVSEKEGVDAIKQVAYESEKEKLNWKLEAEQTKLEKAAFKQWMFLVLSLLLLTLLILIALLARRRFKLQQIAYKNSLLAFELDKVQSEKKLSDTNNNLNAHKVYLTEKEQQITALELKLAETKNSPSAILEEKSGGLKQLLASHLMTVENWVNFKNAFVKEHAAYYEMLLLNFPDLTESNLRIILLTKAGLNNLNVAKILGIIVDAVKKAKQRLRKKYGDGLDNFLL